MPKKLSRSLFSRIGKKLTTTLIGVSLVVSIITTALVLWLSYQDGINRYQETLSQIEKSYKESLTYAVWNYDLQQTDALLLGILNFPGVVYVQVDNNSNVISSHGNKYTSADKKSIIPLIYHFNGKSTELGNLRIYQSYQTIYDEMLDSAKKIIFSLLALISSLLLLMLFALHRLLINRLFLMSRWALNFSLDNLDNELAIRGDDNEPDELSQVANAINQMRLTISKDLALRETEHAERLRIQEQLSLAINNANLGFCRYNVKEDRFLCNEHFSDHFSIGKTEVERIKKPLELFFNRLIGENIAEQKEQIEKLLRGDLIALHQTITLNHIDDPRTLDISFQSINYEDNRPTQILICTLDRTELYRIKQQLAESMRENDKRILEQQNYDKEKIELLKNQIRHLTEKIQKGKKSFKSRYVNSVSQMLSQYLTNWQQAPNQAEIALWKEFFLLNIHDFNTIIDLSEVLKKTLHELSLQAQITITHDLPFSAIIEDNKEAPIFFMQKLLNKTLLEGCKRVHLKMTPNSQMIDFEMRLQGGNLEAGTNTLEFKLAHFMFNVHKNQEVHFQQNGEDILFTFSIPTST